MKMLRKMETHPKFLMFLVAILFTAVFVLNVYPWYQRQRYKPFLKWRQIQLKHWHEYVKEFVEQNDRMPTSLYEAVDDESLDDIVYPYVVGNHPLPNEMRQILSNPELFAEEVQYKIIKAKDRWFIMELRSVKRFPHRLVVDDAGKIYKLEEVEEVK